jgi:hypothetical protein
MLRWISCALLLALAGCGTLFTPPGEIPVSQQLSPAAQAVQSTVNEANILLAAVASVIGQNVLDGIATKAEGQRQLDQVRAYAAEVDRAQKLLESGEIIAAKDRAELTRRLVVALHREVAARARTP